MLFNFFNEEQQHSIAPVWALRERTGRSWTGSD